MKILMTLYQIQDYGGIINHAEFLALGLKTLGHEVDFNILVPKSTTNVIARPPTNFHEYTKSVGTGYAHHQAKGWTGVPKIPYLNEGRRKQFKEDCSKYDAVLWHIPVPTLNKENKGIQQWLDLYDNGTKNIAIIHDGNLPKLYPHLSLIEEKFHSAICVHESAFNSASCIGIPRKMIVNPFDTDLYKMERTKEFEAREGFCAIQVFKAWKRMDTLVRAIPHMKNTQAKIVGGKGIEYRYMTSKDKCKPKYFEPDGTRIWENALKAGMSFVGTVPNIDALTHMNYTRLQIDPSWSLKYSDYGAHFNRTSVEAIIMGGVPLATDLGMKGSKVFEKDKNYIEIPHTATPQQFAEIVDSALVDKQQWLTINSNNQVLLSRFNMKTVAQAYIDLITCDTNTLPKGAVDEQTALNANKNLQFFNIESCIKPTRSSQPQVEGQLHRNL